MSGDHPNTPLRSQPVDVVAWLRCEADAAAREPAPWQMLARAADEIERQTEIIASLRQELKEAKARNTLYLSRLQEHEAREQ
jgi:hypothetical protein